MALTDEQLKALRPGYDVANITLGTPINVTAKQPIDSRLVVEKYEDLYTVGTFDAIYKGMIVSARSTGDVYIYIGPSGDGTGAQTASNWKKVGDVSTAIGGLDATVTKADKGVSVKIVEENGVIKDTSVVTVTPGTINGTATDANVVTGAVVKTYVDGQIKTVTDQKEADIKKYVDTQDTATLSAAKEYADQKVSTAYKIKGCKDNFSELTETGNEHGDVWNIKNAFTLDGKPYPAGTNVVWVEAHKDGGGTDHPSGWDALGGTIDLSPYVKGSDMALATVGGTGKVIRTVTQANGKVTATAEALVADDIPSLDISKIINLDSELAEKANVDDLNASIQSSKASGKYLSVVESVIEENGVISGTINDIILTPAGVDMRNGAIRWKYDDSGKYYTPYIGKELSSYINLSGYTTKENDVLTAEDTLNSAFRKIVDKINGVSSVAGNALLNGGDNVLASGSNTQIDVRNSNLLIKDSSNSTVTFKPSEVELVEETILLKADSDANAIKITATRASDTNKENGITLKTGQDDDPVKIHGVAVETDMSLLEDTDAANVGYVKELVEGVNVGVTSVGGKTGAITLKPTSTTKGAVNLAMDNNVLGASVVGLGSAAYTNATAYANATQGSKADNSVQLSASESAIKENKGLISISNANNSNMQTQVSGDGISLNQSGKAGMQIYLTATDGNTLNLNTASDSAVRISHVLTPIYANEAANKSYVDSAVTSALTWEVI